MGGRNILLLPSRIISGSLTLESAPTLSSLSLSSREGWMLRAIVRLTRRRSSGSVYTRYHRGIKVRGSVDFSVAVDALHVDVEFEQHESANVAEETQGEESRDDGEERQSSTRKETHGRHGETIVGARHGGPGGTTDRGRRQSFRSARRVYDTR